MHLIVSCGVLLSIVSVAAAQTSVDRNISNTAGFDAEPSLGINPLNSNNIVAAWMSTFNLKVGIKTRHSTDGGATWGTIQQVGHLVTSYQSADPSLTFNKNGDAFLSYVDYKTTFDSGAVCIRKSTNGGATWGAPIVVRDIHETSNMAIDRPWIAIDRSATATSGTIYVTTKPAKENINRAHTYMKRSTNDGVTWSADILVDDSTSFPSVNGSMGVVGVGPSGRLFVAYTSPQGVVNRLILASSTNGGQTFQRTVIQNSFSSLDTNYQNGYTLAVNPSVDGNIVVASTDVRFGDPDILLSYSTTFGTQWSSPRRINDDVQSNGVGQDMVWADFSANGTLGIAWRDRRLNGPTATVPFDVYTTISTDGGATTRPNKKISSASSTFSSLTSGNDFLGIALDNQRLHVAWGDWRNSNWEIYFNTELFSTYTFVQESGTVPGAFGLEQNFPNPFNPSTTIVFRLPMQTRVRLIVSNILGKEVAALVNETLPAGIHSVRFDGINHPSGVYYCTLAADGFTQARMMVLIR